MFVWNLGFGNETLRRICVSERSADVGRIDTRQAFLVYCVARERVA